MSSRHDYCSLTCKNKIFILKRDEPLIQRLEKDQRKGNLDQFAPALGSIQNRVTSIFQQKIFFPCFPKTNILKMGLIQIHSTQTQLHTLVSQQIQCLNLHQASSSIMDLENHSQETLRYFIQNCQPSYNTHNLPLWQLWDKTLYNTNKYKQVSPT